VTAMNRVVAHPASDSSTPGSQGQQVRHDAPERDAGHGVERRPTDAAVAELVATDAATFSELCALDPEALRLLAAAGC